MKNDPKRYFGFLLFFLLVTDLLIIFDFPIARQVFAFVYFTFVPGLLILHILKLERLEFLKKFVLSIGLSLVFLMFGGLFVNSLYPYISRPLSLIPLLVFFNIAIILLTLVAYYKSRDTFDVKEVFNFNLDLKGKLVSPMLLPILFPFLAVFGTYLMNTEGNNIVLLIMLILIPAYVIAVVLLENKIPRATYPIAILMIAMSLLFMHSLTSKFITGSDIHLEFYVFQLTKYNYHWDMSVFNHAYNACLSITILPTVYLRLVSIKDMYIYKLLMQILFSTISLVLLEVFSRYLKDRFAFVSAMFFISQSTFIFELPEHIRQEIAFLFFALFVLILFDQEIGNIKRNVLASIFILGIVTSHYTTAYVTLFLLVVTYAITFLFRYYDHVLSPIMVGLLAISSVLWYGQLTQVPFTQTVRFLHTIISNIIYLFNLDYKDPHILEAIGIVKNQLPFQIRFWVRNVTFVFLGAGLLGSIIGNKSRFNRTYISMSISASFLVILALVLPYVTKGYGLTRLYLQSLMILAVFFPLGGLKLFRLLDIVLSKVRILKLEITYNKTISIVVVVLILQNLCATGFIFNLFGNSITEDLSTESVLRKSLYIYESEVVGATWLVKFSNGDVIHTDVPGRQRILIGYENTNNYQIIPPRVDWMFFAQNKTWKNGYLFLRYANINDKVVFPERIFPVFDQDVKNITPYYLQFVIHKNKIYSSNGSEVWR